MHTSMQSEEEGEEEEEEEEQEEEEGGRRCVHSLCFSITHGDWECMAGPRAVSGGVSGLLLCESCLPILLSFSS